MRILQLCAVDFTAYHLLRPLGVALREAGYDVTFCCSPGEGLDRLAEEGFGTRPLPISRSYNVARHALSFTRLFRLFKSEAYDIVHAHTPVAGLMGRVAARAAGVPLVLYTAHGFYFHEGMRGAVRRVFVGLERFGGRISDLVFVQSEEDREDAVRAGIAPSERLVHIGNGVDLTLFGKDVNAAPAARLARQLSPGGGPVVGFVGRIVREKGALEFARAAAVTARRFPGARFVMVGAPLASDRDECVSEIMRIARDTGLGDALTLLGYRRDVPALLALFDLFVLPSYREGMPRSIIEAMATGLPVVATDIRGCREEVVHGETGMLVPPRDVGALAGAMENLLADASLMERMGRAGRNRAHRLFDERRVVASQVEWIDRLAAERRS